TNHVGNSITWSVPSASMSLSRARGSRQPSRRPNFSCHAGVPGVSLPTSFLSQRAQPTSAAFERSRAAGTTRPLMYRRSLSVWKQNWVLIHARLLAGTYSSQTDGGSTTWLSQSNTGKFLRVLVATIEPPCFAAFTPRRTGLLSGIETTPVNDTHGADARTRTLLAVRAHRARHRRHAGAGTRD